MDILEVIALLSLCIACIKLGMEINKTQKNNRPVLICTLFTGQTGKEGIFMRYTYEYKINCVELYRQGKWPETPKIAF